MLDEEQLSKLMRSVAEWNEWRAENEDARIDLHEADLEEEDLRNADLAGACLYKAKLGGANLSGAYLGGAYLYSADLGCADLGAAYLYNANLTAVNLGYVNLGYADLSSANLRGANLSHAQLGNAKCGGTILSAIDLSNVKGLENVYHEEPSTIGVDTLFKSNGGIPARFLRGCGLADWEIEAAKLYRLGLRHNEVINIQQRIFELRMETPIQISPLFVSYSREDTDFVEILGAALDERHVRYWRDTEHAESGPLDRVLDRAIELHRTMLLVLSERSVESSWVAYEIRKADELRKKVKGHVFCPISLDDTWKTTNQLSGELRERIKNYNVVKFQDWENPAALNETLDRVLRGLNLHYQSKAE